MAFLPGMMVYRGLYFLVEPEMAAAAGTSGVDLLWAAAATGLAIAAGISLGAYLGRLISSGKRAGADAQFSAQMRAAADTRE